MYHVELRQFPHNFCHFNLTERELREMVLDAWAQDEWVEVGERKWSPHQATLTVIEGPQLPVEELSMGRGWRNAKRQGKNVTEQLLAAVRAAQVEAGGRQTGMVAAPGVANTGGKQAPRGHEGVRGDEPAGGSGLDVRLAADSLGLELLAKLADAPLPLANVWQLANERYPEHSASDCLKLAESAIRSLTEAQLAVVLIASDGGEVNPCAPGEQVEQVLQAINSWSRIRGSASALIRRA